MRSKNKELMNQIRDYVEEYYLRVGQSPTTRNIATTMEISNGTAYKYVVAMKETGMIEYDGKSIKTKITKKINQEGANAAIVGWIPCGLPELKEEYVEEYVSLPTSLFGKGDFFVLRANGTSMVDAGIDDGDFVVIKKQIYAKDGDIVVALVDGKNTLKRYYCDNINKKIVLRAENENMQDIIVQECYIQGIACRVIKSI